jgi:YVTN family beta-propeller protein
MQWVTGARPTTGRTACPTTHPPGARGLRTVRSIALALLAIAVAACGGAAPITGMRTVRTITLPGSTARFDYQTVDAAAHRLYLAHLGDSTVVVVDTVSKRVVATIPGIAGVHGVLVVPALHRLYASATDDNALTVIDTDTLRVLAHVRTGEYPDGIAYDPGTRQLYVSNEVAGTNTVVDAIRNTVVATMDLGGEVGNTQYDPGSRRILVAVQGRDDLAAIDPATHQVSARFPLPGCRHPHGLLVDPAVQRAAVACDENATLLLLSLPEVQKVAGTPVGDTPDVLALDSSNQHLYVASESGVLAVEDLSGGQLRPVHQGFVGDDAHSVAVDPGDHTIYMPTLVDGHPVLLEMQDA